MKTSVKSNNTRTIESDKELDLEVEDKEVVVIDVGGKKFRTWRSTLRRIPNTRLATLNCDSDYYDRKSGEYFFDRNPDIFENVLDFYRTGELHVPFSKCGWSVKLELDFWGISWKDIKRCCWIHFNSSWCEKVTLEKFDEDVNEAIPLKGEGHNDVWIFLEYPASSRTATIYSVISYLAIVVSVLIIIVSTLDVCRRKPDLIEWADYLNVTVEEVQNNSDYKSNPNMTFRSNGMLVAEHAILSLFAIEYLFRLISCPYKLDFLSQPLNIVDLLSVIPLAVQVVFIFLHPILRFNDTARRLFRAFEVIRVFRLFRLIKKYRGFQVILYSLIRSRAEIALLIVVILMGTILFGSLIYYADDRDMFGNMFAGLWWAVITITTVGYGDYYPVTPFGRVIGTMCALSSMFIIGISVSEIVSSFDVYYRYSKTDTKIDETARTYHPPFIQTEVFRHSPIAVQRRKTTDGISYGNRSYCKEIDILSNE